MASRNSALYVYCLVRAARRPTPARLPPGIPDATRPQLTEVADSLFLVTSEVPIDIYGPPHLEARLRSLEWVSQVAVAHEGVVEHFARARGSTVIPMKMLTMFSSLDKALDDVRGRRRAISRALRRIDGCEEWGIRITRTATVTTRGRVRARAARSVQSGAAFLASRKEARDAAQSARQASRETADKAFGKLRRLARDARRREDGREPGSNPPILEAAFLVTAGARRRFKAEARRQAASCAAAGSAMVLTGPWPAYNFVNAAEERA